MSWFEEILIVDMEAEGTGMWDIEYLCIEELTESIKTMKDRKVTDLDSINTVL